MLSPSPPWRLRAFALAALAGALLSGCNHDRDTLDELREQQRQILARLAAIEQKLDRPARPPAAARPTGPDPTRTYELPAGSSPSKGPAGAPITIVEFSDYQCPFCARSEPLLRQVLDAYPTQVRLVYKQFPLVSIHPQALPAALAAVAAGRQGRFWEMHDLLFANQRALAPEQMREYARSLGLDLQQYDTDVASEAAKAAVQADMALGQRSGVRGTPTIFVNGRVVQARSIDAFRQVIDPLLQAAAAAPSPPPSS